MERCVQANREEYFSGHWRCSWVRRERKGRKLKS
jgi:hypothetical protein